MWPISVLISGQQGNKLHYSNDFLSTSSHVDGVTAQQKMQTAVGDFPFSCSAGSDLVVQRNSGQITSYSYCSFISCERVKGKICKGALDHHFDTIYCKKKKNKPQTNTLVLYQLLINQRVVTAMDLLSEKNAFPAWNVSVLEDPSSWADPWVLESSKSVSSLPHLVIFVVVSFSFVFFNTRYFGNKI